MTVRARISRELYGQVRKDLARRHDFAYERVGFLSARLGNAADDEPLILFTDYYPVSDDQYIEDPQSGARINSDSIRGAMQRVLDTGDGLFHVHSHGGRGKPAFSFMDLEETPRIVSSLQVAGPKQAHGMLLLSNNYCFGHVWLPSSPEPVVADRVSVIGYPLELFEWSTMSNDRFSRQSFLGDNSQEIIERAVVGVPGLGGGGSHITQQLAHIGFLHYRIYDGDVAEDSNLNRLIGAKESDPAHKTPKIEIAERMIKGLQPNAEVESYPCRWQEQPEQLRGCDLIFGCVDGFSERRELEALARRYLIPLIDIGMDVHCVDGEPPRMGGQVILSMPGGPCMFCLGFLNEQVLAQEGERYGDAGPRPQVVWPNGVLASTAVGIAVDLLTDWTRSLRDVVYLEYDGNKGTVKPHVRLEYLDDKSCPHYPANQVGDPFLDGVVFAESEQ